MREMMRFIVMTDGLHHLRAVEILGATQQGISAEPGGRLGRSKAGDPARQGRTVLLNTPG